MGPIKLQEIEQSRIIVLKLLQAQHFKDEYEILTKEGNARLLNSSILRRLRPYIIDGVIVLGGRVAYRIELMRSALAILPSNSKVTELVLQHYHEINGHVGASHVLSSVRRKFWIIRGMSTVRRVLAKCSKCRLLFPRPLGQTMAPLPTCRIIGGGYPFDQCGVDYFGPFRVKIGRSEHKRYGLEKGYCYSSLSRYRWPRTASDCQDTVGHLP
ncbi:hypothetical protein H7673_10950 [Streptococcus dysgalactiae subsp. equisimilis]|nr:hypothetical protein [Streptococcus dysgalactiae subsp. equisimilis]